MSRMFHVTSVRNRKSIQAHGLDWSRMSFASGIAGSRRPEVDGVFLAEDHFTAQFFVRINNTGGAVDIWAVDDIDPADLLDGGSGFSYVPYPIGTDHLTLHAQGLTEQDLPPAVTSTHNGTWTTAYRSNLNITLDDGTELHDDDAHALAQGPNSPQQGTTKR